MTRAARLSAIIDVVAAQGEVTVDELAEKLGVSAATIRRDLDSLAAQRLLTRTHGGAIPQTLAYELPLRYKDRARDGKKERIAATASAMVEPGAVIGLSGGTTTTAIAAALAARQVSEGFTVVTNAVNIAAQLATRPEFKVVVLGGVIHSRTYELVGDFTERLLGSLQLDVAFVGVNGIDAAGASIADEREAAVYRTMAQRARRAVLVADGSTIGARSFATVGGPDLFSTVITDAAVTDAARGELTDAGYDVVIA